MPHHRLLSWYVRGLGRTVVDDLAGDDRPDLVDALHDRYFAWLGRHPDRRG